MRKNERLSVRSVRWACRRASGKSFDTVTIAKICYEDGWYDFAQGQFHKRGSVNEPMPTVLIPRAFPPRPSDETRKKRFDKPALV